MLKSNEKCTASMKPLTVVQVRSLLFCDVMLQRRNMETLICPIYYTA